MKLREGDIIKYVKESMNLDVFKASNYLINDLIEIMHFENKNTFVTIFNKRSNKKLITNMKFLENMISYGCIKVITIEFKLDLLLEEI